MSTQEVSNLVNDLDIVSDSAVYGVSVPGMDGKCGMAAIVLKDDSLPTEGVYSEKPSTYSNSCNILGSY